MYRLNFKASAKINLGLDVVRRREDGYHEVKMIMQTISLYDKINLEKTDKKGITLSVDKSFLPADETNLAYKAAKLLMDEFDVSEGVHIDMKKHIPIAAGMAGGSADAAAVLYGVNKMFRLGLSIEDLKTRGVKIGADVPYCIMRGTALSEGIGEILTPLPAPPSCKVLVLKPPINVSTKYVYENLHANELKYHPDIDGMVEAIKNSDLDTMVSKMGNVLETVTVKEYPIIQEIKELMMENGAIGSLMSGSGPTVFGLFNDEEKAKSAYLNLKAKDISKQIYLTDFYPRKEGGTSC